MQEVARWSPQAQWPVLIEDDVLAAQFVRRYRPQRVLRRVAATALSEDPRSREQEMEAAAAAAWGGGSDAASASTAAGLPAAPGLIVSDASDAAAAAAVLLAAGRGQDIVGVGVSAGTPNQVLSADVTARFRSAIESAVNATGRSWRSLGDDIDAITLCRTAGARVRTAMPIASVGKPGDEVALTDVLGRSGDGSRWAFTGWMFGDAAYTAYAANCSLFLPRIDAWMCNSYPQTQPWVGWGLAAAAKVLESAGWKTTLRTDETITSLRAGDMSGLKADLALLNSKGNADFFRMHGGKDADPGDVPILDRPAAVSMIHSWSLRSPADADTVGGRWLERGAYAMVGSSAEPQLSAFVPPELLVRRLAGGVPMLVAARWWPDQQTPMKSAWRINTLGDPLMIAPPPKGTVRRPVPAATEASGQGVSDVEQEAVAAMQEAEATPSDAAFARAIRLTTLLGRDVIATQLWTAARQHGVGGPAAARAAFGPRFRVGDRDALLDVWTQLPEATSREADMFWAAWAASLGEGTSDAVVRALMGSITPGGAVARAEALVPLVMRRFGAAAAGGLLRRATALTTTTRGRRALQALQD